MEVHFVALEASSAPPLLAFSPLSPFAVFADDEAVEWLCLQPREIVVVIVGILLELALD